MNGAAPNDHERHRCTPTPPRPLTITKAGGHEGGLGTSSTRLSQFGPGFTDVRRRAQGFQAWCREPEGLAVCRFQPVPDPIGSAQRSLADGIAGVLVLHNGPVSVEQLRRCALTFAGPASFLSHTTAAFVQGLRVRPDDRLHVTIPHGRHPHSHGFVVVHQSPRACRLERNGDLR